jgi:GTPase-associated system-like protein
MTSVGTELLREFLAAGLFDVGDDDVKLGYLRDAAKQLAKDLGKDPRLIPSYAMVSVDPEIRADEPVLEDVEARVLEEWNTMRSRFVDRPTPLLRGVIIQALDSLVTADPRASAVVWLSSSSYLEANAPVSGRDVLERFVQRAGVATETAAAAKWGLGVPEPAQISTPLIKMDDGPARSVDRTKLRADLFEAAGPHDTQGTAGASPNPHWPNTGQQWSHEFAPRAEQAISSAIEGALSRDGSTKAIEALLRGHAKAVRAALKSSITQTADITRAERRRTELLWWRETLYSSSSKTSYRSMAASTAALTMARDVVEMLPALAPRSVEFLLREALRESVGSPLPELSMRELCEAISADEGARSALGDGPSNALGRVPLVAMLRQHTSGDKFDAGSAKAAIGVDPERKLPLDDLAVWVLRDLQAGALVDEMDTHD